MVQEQLVTTTDERRCPNCGTRVARDAENCFMCGRDLRMRRQRGRSVSLIDALLVLAVLAVLGFWWQLGRQVEMPAEEAPQLNQDVPLLPSNIPVIATDAPASQEAVGGQGQVASPSDLTGSRNILSHEVLEGETLIGLATRYNVSVEEIQAANDMDTETILVGRLLIIPVNSSAADAAASSSSQEGERLSSSFRYTVREGDTYFTIAVQYGTSVEAVLRANGKTENDFIRPGDQLLLPIDVPSDVLAGATGRNMGNESSRIYSDPRQIGPANGSKFNRDEPILLRWLSVDQLQPNEWYVLLIYPSDGNASELPTRWTKANSYRLDMELAPSGGSAVTYKWQVSVVRVRPNPNGPPGLEAASKPSDLRNFTWE